MPAGADFLEGAVATWFILITWPLRMIVALMWKQQEIGSTTFLWMAIIGSTVGVSIMADSRLC